MIQEGHVPAEDVKRHILLLCIIREFHGKDSSLEYIHETQSTATVLIQINWEDIQFMKCIIPIIDDGRYTEE